VNISQTFILRPIATALLMAALAFAGMAAFPFLPVAPVPQVDLPTIQVTAGLPGASPETIAGAVASPLERQFGQIPGVTQMTSLSTLGATTIVVQFDMNRNSDGAAQDIQAAITTAAKQLPINLYPPPNYKKVNPADFPIMILALTSDVLPLTRVDDYADNILAQQISQVPGVAQVGIGGEQKPSIRVQIDPGKLSATGLTLEDVRTILANATTTAAKGTLNGPAKMFTIAANDQLTQPGQYDDVILAYRSGAAIRVRDVGQAVEGPTDITVSAFNGLQRCVMLVVYRLPGANIVETVDTIRTRLPALRAIIPPSIKIEVILDRTVTIRAAVADVEFTLALTIALVVLVILIFIRNLWVTIIPAVTLPLALFGSFAVMYLCGFSIDNLSLMALTIAVGFVVDDAIVVVENIYRHLEEGKTSLDAALNGAREIGFTVMSISASLIAAFIPLLLMGGFIGRIFREFAVTATASIAVSAIVSLTLAPMMAARFMRRPTRRHGQFYLFFERGFERFLAGYRRTLDVALRHQPLTLAVFSITVALSAAMMIAIPKGFFPNQDTGTIFGLIEAAQDASPAEMIKLDQAVSGIIVRDPDIEAFGSNLGNASTANTSNTGRFYITLKPREQRSANAYEIIARLRTQFASLKGVAVFMQVPQDITVGGRLARAQYQYTLQDSDIRELAEWSSKMLAKMKTMSAAT
jgi:multidrug efflux pump subunit AcrB